MDTNKTAGEEARRQLHKNAASNLEQVLAATPHKTPTVRPPAPYHENYSSKTNQTCGTLLEKQGRTYKWCTLMIPTHGRAKVGRPARTYIQQLCEDTGCCPEDLPEAMNGREKWRERVRDIRATSTTWWWWWWHRSIGQGITPFAGLPHFTLNTYLILLSVKQGGIKYHFKSLWDWTQVPRIIGEYSTH